MLLQELLSWVVHRVRQRFQFHHHVHIALFIIILQSFPLKALYLLERFIDARVLIV